MKRRNFVAGIAGAAAWWPLVGGAQEPAKTYRLGLLDAVPAEQNAANLHALRRGLSDLGYIEGRNLVIEYRSSNGQAERFPDLASELVRLGVDLIVARGTPATIAVRNTSQAVPVVMATMGGPGSIVANFANPKGNITGVITFSTELTAKRIEILKDLVPSLTRVALLHNMSNPAVPPEWEAAQAAARALSLQAELLDVRRGNDLDHALEQAAQGGIDGLIIGADGLTQVHKQRIVDFAARIRLPAVYPSREFVEIGGLVAYAVNYPELYLRLASFVDKTFKGAKPGELPVEQPAKFELVINAKTAKGLGITIPPTLLFDEIIE